PNADSAVYTLVVGDKAVYAGGGFTSIGGLPRVHVAALDPTTGVPTPWNPGIVQDDYSSVLSLVLDATVVFVGGSFELVGSQLRHNLAAIDARTGTVLPWNPNPDADVYGLAYGAGVLYAGGWFTSIGGQSRRSIAALDPLTGVATAWNPGADNAVAAFAIGSGKVYAGGLFTSIGGQSRLGLAALDPVTGLVSSWRADADRVSCLAIVGRSVYAGGSFKGMGGLPQAFLAGITLDSPTDGPGAIAAVPSTTVLRGNVPNPFNPSTTIRFDLARRQHVALQIYDVDGRLVRTLVDETLESDRHEVFWNGTDDSGHRAAS